MCAAACAVGAVKQQLCTLKAPSTPWPSLLIDEHVACDFITRLLFTQRPASGLSRDSRGASRQSLWNTKVAFPRREGLEVFQEAYWLHQVGRSPVCRDADCQRLPLIGSCPCCRLVPALLKAPAAPGRICQPAVTAHRSCRPGFRTGNETSTLARGGHQPLGQCQPLTLAVPDCRDARRACAEARQA